MLVALALVAVLPLLGRERRAPARARAGDRAARWGRHPAVGVVLVGVLTMLLGLQTLA